MADDYDPSDPPTYNPMDDDTYDPDEYSGEQNDAPDEDDDYDPSNINFGDKTEEPVLAQAATDRPSAPSDPQPPKIQTRAVFIVEDSDDEQDAHVPPPSQLNGTSGSQSGLDAAEASEAQDVSLHSAPQDTAAPSTSLNGSTTVSNAPASTSVTPVPTSSLQVPAAHQGKAISPVASAAPTPQPPASNAAPAPTTPQPPNGIVTAPPARLPLDKVGQLEDRIKEDPKGDTNAWITLIDHYRGKAQDDLARNVYARLLQVFPTSVAIWTKRAHMEQELDEPNNLVAIFNEALMKVPNVEFWKLYLDHVRRALPLLNDTTGQNRAQISAAFDLTLKEVGIDPDAGILWREYIDFVKDGPGIVGGQSWQDMQKVDLLRKAYQRAIKLPHSDFVRLWKDYELFEMGLHKGNGRKHIQEQSPHYMQARTAKMQLDQKLQGLDRASIPRLPPLYGCEGEDEFATQVEKFRAWIAWERDEDPLVYKGDEDDAWRRRVLYAYKQATMTLYLYPQIWFEAATWCFAQGVESLAQEGEQFLEKGITANPESVLLALMKADRIESNLETGNTDEILIRNGEKLDVPYENVHTALYAIRNKQTEKDKVAILQIKDYFASLPPEDESRKSDDGDDDDESVEAKPKTREEQQADQVEAVKTTSAPILDTLKRVISSVWVAKMQAFRRVQGQGKPAKKGEDSSVKVVKGFRGIFGDARPRGPLSSEVYTASALMEWNCYRDPSADKIFERGMKLFPEDEAFILEYIKHLITENDITNARVVFESTISKILNSAKMQQAQKQEKCWPLFGFMHEYESKYGDLAQIHKLEKRMVDLYPKDTDLSRFGNRFTLPSVDVMHVQILLSPTQAQPKAAVPHATYPPQQMNATAEAPAPTNGPELLLGPNGPYIASPKRPLDDSDSEVPRKILRAESPLKGAAGMRVQVAKNAGNINGAGGGSGGFATKTFVPAGLAATAGPPPLPPQIHQILSMIPNAAAYTQVRFDPAKLVQLLNVVDLRMAQAQYNM